MDANVEAFSYKLSKVKLHLLKARQLMEHMDILNYKCESDFEGLERMCDGLLKEVKDLK